jgi:hypothetical protein
MKKFLTAFLVLLMAFILLFTTGCGKDDDDKEKISDNSAGFVAKEVSDMGKSVVNLLSSMLLKSETDSITIIEYIPWHFEIAIQGFITYISATYPYGSAQRADTAWFYDERGTTMIWNISFNAVSSLALRRGTRATWFGDTIDIFTNLTALDTAVIFNGTMRGSYNSDALTGSNTITDVRYNKAGGIWGQYPSSGSILMERPLMTCEIVFTGGNTAIVTYTRRLSGITQTVTVNLLTGSET